MVITNLNNFKLYYEDLEGARMQKAKTSQKAAKVKVETKKANKSSSKKQATPVKKVSLKDKMLVKLQPLRSKFNNMLDRIKNPSKTKKKLTKAQKAEMHEDRKRAILGIGLLLVVVSIAYSTSVIFIGVDSNASRIALFPQALFAIIILFKAFFKLYK